MQPVLQVFEVLLAVGHARFDAVQTGHHLFRQGLDAGDLDLAEPEARAAVELHVQVDAVEFGVDVGEAVGDACGGKILPLQPPQQAGLVLRPQGVAEHHAGLQRPGAAQGGGALTMRFVSGEIADEGKIQRSDARRSSRIDADGGPRAVVQALDRLFDGRREIAFGREQVANLVRGAAGEKLEARAGKPGIVALAQDLQMRLEQRPEFRGNDEFDLVAGRLRRRATDTENEQGGEKVRGKAAQGRRAAGICHILSARGRLVASRRVGSMQSAATPPAACNSVSPLRAAGPRMRGRGRTAAVRHSDVLSSSAATPA